MESVTSHNIHCVWYPSGGFGHFINAVITRHGIDFVRPCKAKYRFSSTGNSHDCELTAPRFSRHFSDYQFNFDQKDKQYVVLIDNGINDESEHWTKTFPKAKKIKVSYSAITWPIVASTMIHKILFSDYETALAVDQPHWLNDDTWAQREKYFLFLSQHPYRTMWAPQSDCLNMLIDDLLQYNVFRGKLHEIGIVTTNFSQLWQDWFNHNKRYIDPVLFSHQVIEAVGQQQSMDISHCVDLWTQAVVNYQIWHKFNCVIPANDYGDWFTNTDQIVALLSQQHALH